MSRQIITISTLLGLALICLASDAQAGCGHHRGYSRRYARPVTAVRPVTVVRRIVAPKVVVAPRPEPNHPTVPAGSQLTLPGNFLGNQPGSVFMVFNNIKLPVKIHRWAMTGVTVTLPPMAIKESVLIRLDIVLPSGKLGKTQKVRVTAPAPVVLHPVAPTPQLPTNPAIQQAQAAPAGPMVAPASGSSPASQAIVLPRAAAPPASALSSGRMGTPSQPIMLPAATASSARAGSDAAAAGTPSQPIVLPAATAPAGATAAQAPQSTGQPIVLPPAKANVPTAPAQAEADPMADNPILLELEQEVGQATQQESEESAAAPSTDQVSSPGLLSVIFAALTK